MGHLCNLLNLKCDSERVPKDLLKEVEILQRLPWVGGFKFACVHGDETDKVQSPQGSFIR